MTLLLRLYGLGASLAAPVACRLTKRKLVKHRVDPKRFCERAGVATAERPEGPLLWLHGASVGESVSVLRLVEHLGEQHPTHHFLISTGTATSAHVLANRLPARTQHQFAPLDGIPYIRRFLAHWRPDAAIFVESEFWPNMLCQTARRGIPMALVNARISDGSARNWARAPRTARALTGLFRFVHCQDQRTADHLRRFGAMGAEVGRNLKSFSGPLPYDDAELARLRQLLKGRPLWLAASTHPGEDEIMLETHRQLLSDLPDLLLLLVPRHPERADTIEVQIAQHGLHGARRSTGGRIDSDTQVYLADTLGEMGLWYALSPITCLCGSFTPVGGHNPYEPAYAGSAVIHGPLYANFAPTYAEMHALEVADGPALTDALRRVLTSAEALSEAQEASRTFAAAQLDALDEIASALSNALSLR